MGNEIVDRVAFFLKDHPPFSFLDYQDLEETARSISVRYLESDEILFDVGESGHDACYVIRQGHLQLASKNGTEYTLADECESGDILGIRALLTGKDYVLRAMCMEESLLYEIPKKNFQKLLDQNPRFSLFLAAGYAAGQAVVREPLEAKPVLGPLSEPMINYAKEVLTCQSSDSIQSASAQMRDRNVGSILVVDQKNHPIGIITDTDLRKKVVATAKDVTAPVQEIMSSPVATIHPVFTHTEVVVQMMRRRLHHLVVTADGTDRSEIVGIISDHDVLLSQNDNPASLIKSLRRSHNIQNFITVRDKAEKLVHDFVAKDLSVRLISNFITEINDQLIENALSIAMEEIPEAKTISFCWLSLGSEGREEQLLRTDQDNALIFKSNGDLEAEQDILLKMSERVNEILMACGFVECPANIMARNPKYCQDLQGWQRYFIQWIETPDPKALMNATIFFDFRGVYGDFGLAQQLQDFLLERMKDHEIFLNHLAANAIQNPPPLGFFKQFLVEKAGHNKEDFDIKKRAMMPLSDAARTLCLSFGEVKTQNTVNRFKRLQSLDSKNQSLFEEAGQAYEVLMKIRAKYGLLEKNDGRFIPIDRMNKLEKQMLKSAFIPIKEIQRLLEVKFQLAYFR